MRTRANKAFDCVDMKNRIQAEMFEEKNRLGAVEQERQAREWLDSSSSPIAVWWREAVSAQMEEHKMPTH